MNEMKVRRGGGGVNQYVQPGKKAPEKSKREERAEVFPALSKGIYRQIQLHSEGLEMHNITLMQ